MTHSAISLILILSSVCSAQTTDTLTLRYSESKYDSTLYKRIVHYDLNTLTYHVTDTYLSGQLALTGDYLSIDPTVKEEFWNYHQTHIN
jgi:hypothetical protein